MSDIYDDCRTIRLSHATLKWRIGPGATAEIVDIEVDSDSRRQGYGRRLLEMLLNVAKENGFQLVYAICRADNDMGQLFYECCKFRVVGVLREFYKPGIRGVDAIMYGRSPEGPV